MKPKSIGVTTSELVILALHKFEAENPDKAGCSPDQIIQYISKKYNLDKEDIEASVHAALFRGLTFGIFSQNKGRFRLEEVPEPPAEPPEDKLEKMGAYLVEASSGSFMKKRKKGASKLKDTEKEPWIDDEDENWSCQLAKRRKEKPKAEELSLFGFPQNRS